jgi:hypothetical protein
MAPGVGLNPPQFKALARLVTNYASAGASSVRTSVKPSNAILTRRDGDELSATYDFSAREHGTYELAFELLRSFGEVFHTDRVRIEVPAVPGMGN